MINREKLCELLDIPYIADKWKGVSVVSVRNLHTVSFTKSTNLTIEKGSSALQELKTRAKYKNYRTKEKKSFDGYLKSVEIRVPYSTLLR